MKVLTFGKALGVGCAVAATLLATVATAAANPPAGEYRQLAGVGSDTTQDALNGLGETITVSGAKVIASYDARPAGTIKTKSTGCEFPRPDGSGEGRKALKAAENDGGNVYQGVNVTGCVDYARSSSYGGGSSPQTTGNYTYVPFGVDAVSFAVNEESDLPTSLTFVQLQRIYRCLTTVISGVPVKPLLVQPGSGTRQFWLSKMGIAEADIANGDYPCLVQTVNGQQIQEHDARVLAGHNDYIVPFSVAQFIAQGNAAAIRTQTGVTVEDRRGTSRIGRVNGLQPIVGGKLNINFRPQLIRDVYNVVPTRRLGEPLIANTFVGQSSAVCTNRALIELFGFGYRTTDGATLFEAACGSTQLKAAS
ncbi:substrate-binding domain-containing protein [Dactylosporangium fulvum]|uniref:Substrate-binding domain-containing protein n=1 Tax=Dactylosporangium fulvum TaxID=53359 RepID=A0ABY5VN33_9ACTN|nr:substrate-binding domain-containing protein [Dactylosporangium fulvum]UWP79143.1 substrate-binding domain-containing protein [Dactylosporangium fulvum]